MAAKHKYPAEKGPMPRSLANEYPPKEIGVQNELWSSMSAELRNIIYIYCASNEEENVVNVLYRPEGVPRRFVRGVETINNFPHSHWGFTQTCTQVREEFVPWLLEKRKVRAPLGNLNDYVETFHPPHPASGRRIGWVESMSITAPLPSKGVEIIQLLKLRSDNPGFHFKLTPTPLNSTSNYLRQITATWRETEIQVVRKFDIFYDATSMKTRKRLRSGILPRSLSEVGIEAIHITTTTLNLSTHDKGSTTKKRMPRVEIILELAKSLPGRTRDEQITLINHMIYQSGLAKERCITVRASVAGGKAVWLVRVRDIVDVAWTEDSEGGEEICWRLGGRAYERKGFKEHIIESSEFGTNSYYDFYRDIGYW